MAGLNISPYQSYNMTHNYSSLFASMNKASSDNGWDLSGLADYASIKNGSYGKLVKSSYAKANQKSSDTGSSEATKSTYKSAEERRKAREAAASSTTNSSDSNKTIDGATARRLAREAKTNKTAATGEDQKALTTKDVSDANVGSKTAEAASAIAEQDSAKAIYNSNAVTSPSMSELMASTFDTNI